MGSVDLLVGQGDSSLFALSIVAFSDFAAAAAPVMSIVGGAHK
jgi:hypothetical protein